MNVKLLALFASSALCSAYAQSYMGYTHDNYAGVQAVLYNPAAIVDSRFKTDINLISVSASATNDAYGVALFDSFKNGYKLDVDSNTYLNIANNAVVNTDVMGPSVLFNIKPKHSLAIFTRARLYGNALNVNGNVVNELLKTQTNNFNYSIGSPNATINAWGEIGVSYAAVLYQKSVHFFKGGLTAKYLQGIANYHLQTDGVNLSYRENVVLPQNSEYTSTGTAVYGSSQDFTTDRDVHVDSKSSGIGFDLGLVYEWRPGYDAEAVDTDHFRNANKYKLRVGLSITDLGAMKYVDGVRNSYDLNRTITQADANRADDFDEFLKNNYNATVINGVMKAYLPTALHMDLDWNVRDRFYLNANSDWSIVDKNKLNQNSIANRFSLTPRYESRNFSASIPVTYADYSEQVQLGVGLRTGIFFLGSSSILSNALSDNSKSADFYLGFKVPVYHKAGRLETKDLYTDTDGDGVLDTDDLCPTIAGDASNNGCPWGDVDGDLVLDNADACPTIAGVIENNGCPWEDTDQDGLLDNVDLCPTEAGPASNNGCPIQDTDGDGISDAEDVCPDIKGTLENKGCPEVSVETIKVLNDFAKAILFDSSKATITETSYDKLTEILKVMNAYTTANFRLEGYTDSSGSAMTNLQLSKERAATVKNYLIEHGIAVSRLTSDGFGIEKPIASNATAAGRAANRRVEIILVK